MTELHKEYIKKYKKEKLLIIIFQFSLLFLIILFWELFSTFGLIDEFIFSKPSDIFKLFSQYLVSNELLTHTLVSTYEVILGLIFGTILGLLIAILLYELPFLAKIADPFLVVFNALPKTALAPILIIWVGANIKGSKNYNYYGNS